MMKSNLINYSAKQTGAVLIVSLIMLFLMSILAMSSMSRTVVQERMAGNVIDKQRAFQAAEAALRAAERYVEDTDDLNFAVFDNESSPEATIDYAVNNDGDTCLNGLCTPSNHTTSYTGASSNKNCTDASFIPERWTNCAAGTAAAVNNLNVWSNSARYTEYQIKNALLVNAHPRYIIEFMGYVHPDGTSPTNLCGMTYDIVWPTQLNKDYICNRQHLYRITAVGYGADVNTQVMLQSTYVKTL